METLTETEKAWITMMVQAYGMNEQTALSYIQNVNTNKGERSLMTYAKS